MRRRRLRLPAGRVAMTVLMASVYAFLLAPLVVVAVASLDAARHGHFNFPPRELSLAWYGRIPRRYFETLGVSLVLATVAALIACLLGIPAALGLVRGRMRGREILGAVLRAPLQIPFVVTGVAFLQAYYLVGDLFGVNLIGSLTGLALGHVFVATPYVIGTVGAVLQRFNLHLEEAALSLGASRWATFRRVTLPLIMPGVYAGVLYAFIASFGDVPIAMFTTFPVEMFHSMEFDFSPAMLAVSTLIVLFSIGLLWLIQRIAGLDILLRGGGRE